MASDTAPQGNVATERPVAPQAHDAVQDFTPSASQSTSWSEVANQCWNGDFKSCATSFGQAFKEAFGLGNQKEAAKTLEDRAILPETRIADSAAAVVDARAESLPKALQGDNKQHTETVLNAKAAPEDRLKAAGALINAGITGFTVQGPDGGTNNVRLESEKAGNRNMLGIYVANNSGAEINALRGVQKADGTIEQQKDGQGRFVDYKGRGAALLDRISAGAQVVEGTGSRERDRDRSAEPPEKKARRKDETKRSTGPEQQPEGADGERQRDQPKQGQLKSPFERKYAEGDQFKGLASVYWEDSQTASGIAFKKDDLTAASREFPFGTVLKIRNPENGRETRVVITDNGPFEGKMMPRPDGSGRVHERVLDISDGAQKALKLGREVKPLDVTVESIPDSGAWGGSRRNLSKAGKQELRALVRRITDQG